MRVLWSPRQKRSDEYPSDQVARIGTAGLVLT